VKPEYLLVGDDIIRNISLINTEVCTAAAAQLQFVFDQAVFLSNLPEKGLIISCGTYDAKSTNDPNYIQVEKE